MKDIFCRKHIHRETKLFEQISDSCRTGIAVGVIVGRFNKIAI